MEEAPYIWWLQLDLVCAFCTPGVSQLLLSSGCSSHLPLSLPPKAALEAYACFGLVWGCVI